MLHLRLDVGLGQFGHHLTMRYPDIPRFSWAAPIGPDLYSNELRAWRNLGP
jgi:hypothetical protein